GRDDRPAPILRGGGGPALQAGGDIDAVRGHAPRSGRDELAEIGGLYAGDRPEVGVRRRQRPVDIRFVELAGPASVEDGVRQRRGGDRGARRNRPTLAREQLLEADQRRVHLGRPERVVSVPLEGGERRMRRRRRGTLQQRVDDAVVAVGALPEAHDQGLWPAAAGVWITFFARGAGDRRELASSQPAARLAAQVAVVTSVVVVAGFLR